MIIYSKSQLELALREYKNFASYAWDLVETYKNGSSVIGIKKNLKKALEIVKYYEKKKNTLDNNYFIYYGQYEIYKELGKYDVADEFLYQYYLNQVKNYENDKKINLGRTYKGLFELDFKKVVNVKNGKISDKKQIPTMLKHLDLFTLNAESRGDFYFEKNIKSLMVDFFSKEEYQRLFFVHILSDHYYYASNASLELIKKFKEEDFVSYIKILSKKTYDPNKILGSFCDDLKIYYNYHFKERDAKNKLAYANAIVKSEKFFIKDSNVALEIYKECHEKGNKEALKLIVDFYNKNKMYSRAVTYFESYTKKHRSDKQAKLILADFYISESKVTNDTYHQPKFLKGLKIYEENLDILSDAQYDFLANVYALGICVKPDLIKAKEYSKTKLSSKTIEGEEVKLFGKLKVKDKSLKPIIDDLFNGFQTLDGKKLRTLFEHIYRGDVVEKDPNLLFKLATFMENNKLPEAYLASYICYALGFGVESNLDIADSYLEKGMKLDGDYGLYANYLYHFHTKKDPKNGFEYLEKAANNNFSYALDSLASMYYEGKYVEKDLKKSYELYKKLYEQKEYMALTRFIIMVKSNEYETLSLEEQFEIYKTIADNTNNPVACRFLYDVNLELKKLSDKEGYKYLIRSAENDYLSSIKLVIEKEKDNKKEWYKWILKAHELGDVYAISVVASKYYFGDDELKIKEDQKKAFELYSSIEEKSSNAKCMIGRAYYYGSGAKTDYKKAYEYLKKAYEEKVSGAATYLAHCYHYGRGVKTDYKKALELYQEGAKLGGYYKNELAYCYLEGLDKVLDIDYEKAIELYTEGLKDYQSSGAYISLAICYSRLDDYKNCIKTYNEALKIYPKNTDIYYNLGIVYRNSKNLEKDYKKSLEYFTKSAELGDKDANLCIAELYMFRNYGFNDEKKAESYIIKAYNDKVEGSAPIMAYFYEHEKHDEKKAYEVIKDYEGENALKYIVLGNLYYSGKFLNKDYTAAFKNFQKSYELNQEDPYIWFRLGRCYYFGHGVERDVNRAYDFISLAKNEDFSDAVRFYDEYFKDRN